MLNAMKRNKRHMKDDETTIIENKLQQRIFIFVISLAAFMASLDGSIVTISLPSIAQDFNASASAVSWVLMGYLLVVASFLLVFGKLGDLKGLKKVFIIGFFIFTPGSFLCGISASLSLLIIFRVLQAIGAAMFAAITPGMVPAHLPTAMRGKALGYVSTFTGLGLAVGPIIGGFITEYWGWHWIFFINVPIGIVAIIIGMKVVPFSKGQPKKHPFDVAGAALIFFALFSLLLTLNRGPRVGWTSAPILGGLLVSIVLWIAFYVQEKRSPDPIMDLNLFHNKVFSLGNGAYLMMLLVYSGAIFILPFYFEYVKGLATDIAGMYLTVPSLMMVIVGPPAGALSDRVGSRGICSLSALMGAVAFFLLSMLGVESSSSFIFASMGLMGIAVGVFGAPMASLIMGHSAAGKEGVASSIMATVRKMGTALGVLVFEVVLVQTLFANRPEGAAHTLTVSMLVPGFHNAFLAGVICCIIALVLSLAARD
jgi:EmrB/QacA subfamily drug resistance transporter